MLQLKQNLPATQEESWTTFLESFEKGRKILKSFQSENPKDWDAGLVDIRLLEKDPPEDMPNDLDGDALDELIVRIASKDEFWEQCPARALFELGQIAKYRSVVGEVDDLASEALRCMREKIGPSMTPENVVDIRDTMSSLLASHSDEVFATVTMMALDQKDLLNAKPDRGTLLFWRQLTEKNIVNPQWGRPWESQKKLIQLLSGIYGSYASFVRDAGFTNNVSTIVEYGGIQAHQDTMEQVLEQPVCLYPYGKEALLEGWGILVKAERQVLNYPDHSQVSGPHKPSPYTPPAGPAALPSNGNPTCG